jgi:hypothetical protein
MEQAKQKEKSDQLRFNRQYAGMVQNALRKLSKQRNNMFGYK